MNKPKVDIVAVLLSHDGASEKDDFMPVICKHFVCNRVFLSNFIKRTHQLVKIWVIGGI